MKKMMLVLVVAILFAGCASMKPSENAEYQKVLDFQMSKDELFSKTMIWVAETFNSAEAVIEHSDKETGVIMGNSSYHINVVVRARYSFKIEAKENKIRATFYAFRYSDNNKPIAQLSVQESFEYVDGLLSNLESFLLKEDDNW